MKKWLKKVNISAVVFYALEISVVVFLSRILLVQLPQRIAGELSSNSAVIQAFHVFNSYVGTKEYEDITTALAAMNIGTFLPLFYCLCWVFRIIRIFFFTSKTENPQLS
ncbi:hypothetical protein [Paenibacillus polymyxa]|uniref:hypothetical protein n=1 Tax=Paenibacillus polymyxa TaxID=1406 RepID=UPI0021E42563|nr:hypothetical protein [Paenibacillus polymyxa]